jgi:hypothetical protein
MQRIDERRIMICQSALLITFIKQGRERRKNQAAFIAVSHLAFSLFEKWYSAGEEG